MKKLLVVYLLFPMISFAQGAENPPPPMAARSIEAVDAGPGHPGFPINNSFFGIVALGFGVTIAGGFFAKYRFEK